MGYYYKLEYPQMRWESYIAFCHSWIVCNIEYSYAKDDVDSLSRACRAGIVFG